MKLENAPVVYLVGAGPGDPRLLTLRAAEVLSQADAVVYDHLVDPRILAHAPSGAELIDVGKRPGQSSHQARINELLVTLARRFHHVVRLKGGDPFVFGRGGEEAARLAEEGIAYEVVPGVSSAIAVPAYAGIPVTHRGTSQGFIVMTGHQEQGGTPGYPWEVLASSGLTLIVLMGVAHRGAIAESLLGAGMPPGTPVAAITWGTTARQHDVRATLGDLAEMNVESPAVIVIGEAAALDFKGTPPTTLAGTRIVVAGVEGPADPLSTALAALGAEVLTPGPAVGISPGLPGVEGLGSALERIGDYEWCVFTSPETVDAVIASLADVRNLAGRKLAALGNATVQRLAELHLLPDAAGDWSGAWEFEADFPSGAGRLLLAQSDGADLALADGMRAKGWEVDAIVAATSTGGKLAEADLVLFTSPASVENFLETHGRAALPRHRGSANPETSTAMELNSIAVDFEAGAPGIKKVVAACERWRAAVSGGTPCAATR